MSVIILEVYSCQDIQNGATLKGKKRLQMLQRVQYSPNLPKRLRLRSKLAEVIRTETPDLRLLSQRRRQQICQTIISTEQSKRLLKQAKVMTTKKSLMKVTARPE